MAEWVTVNGARIERSFLQENVSEARAYTWVRMRWTEASDHGHCMVCGVALAEGDDCRRSEGGFICPYCFGEFMRKGEGGHARSAT